MKQKLLLSDFAQWLSEKEDISKKDAQTFLRALFQIIEQGLTDDQFVKIKGLGTFKLVTVNERESVNIKTGERFQIGEHNKVTFIPDSSMKEIINRPFAHFESVDLSDETDTAELDAVDEAIKQEFPQILKEETSAAEEAITTTVEVITASSHPNALSEEEETASEELITAEKTTEEVSTDISTTTETLADETKERNQAEAEAEERNTDAPAEPETVVIAEKETCSEPQAPEETLLAPEEASAQVTATAEKTNTVGTDAEIGVSQPTTLTVSGGTVEEQEHPTRPWLRRTLLSLLVLLLCAASYFAGYYRLLCPPCAPDAPATKAQNDSSKTKIPQTTKKDSTAVSAVPQVISTTPTETQDTVNLQQKEEKAVTRTHTIRIGDNLSRIARKYYGDDCYVDFIIQKNNLKNADNIHVGKVLVLPPLDTEKEN